jgi:hypothetical protein
LDSDKQEMKKMDISIFSRLYEDTTGLTPQSTISTRGILLEA